MRHPRIPVENRRVLPKIGCKRRPWSDAANERTSGGPSRYGMNHAEAMRGLSSLLTAPAVAVDLNRRFWNS
ncbi:hypothetical protein SV7mr_05980 [Stieleria bergensis]|uniref:Uncharacterized protein n=1 Tax=Stieleria bergensis TaxID=2528025 RepID=A0A517SPT4_9BACT|nr:hypothetical protein SV7mr_05980 [Planctomycetes bacterium SV_7m_r]